MGFVKGRNPIRGWICVLESAEAAVDEEEEEEELPFNVDAEGKEPSGLGWVYAITVYTFLMNGTPNIISPILLFATARSALSAWIRPVQNWAWFPVGGSVVRSSGCNGISGRSSRVMVRFRGVVQGT